MSRCLLDLNPEGMTDFGRERNARAQEQGRTEDPENVGEQERAEELVLPDQPRELEERPAPMEVEQLEVPPIELELLDVEQPEVPPMELEFQYPPPRGPWARKYHSSRRHGVRNGVNVFKEVAIGTGRTIIKRERYVTVDWTNYNTATRTMLVAIFSRRTMSTHTLTGRRDGVGRTPRLNKRVINDIVMEVTKRCGVGPACVKMVIAAKCSEEYQHARMLRLRLLEIEAAARRAVMIHLRAYG